MGGLSTLRYVDATEVSRVLPAIDPVAAVRRMLELHARGETVLPAEAYLPWQAEDGAPCRSLSMPGLIRGGVDVAGTKIINASPANLDRGLPRACGLIVLFDLATARPRCLLDGTQISALRTAAVSVCAVQQLAAATRVLALIGCGPLAAAHLRLMAAHLPDLAEVRLYDLAPARAQTLHAEAQNVGPAVTVTVAASVRQAVRDADVIVPATTTTEGYLPLAWLRPGAVVVNVSLDDVLPEVVLGADLVVVDDWGLVAADDRRLVGRMLRAGQVYGPDDEPPPGGAARRVDAELGQILIGAHPGRTAPEQVVLVNPFGMAIADLAVAAAVETAVGGVGGGQWLPLG